MIDAQNEKVTIGLAASTTATTDAFVVDRLEADYVTIDVGFGTASATTAPTVLRIQESDTTDSTAYANITEFVGGGAGGFTIPARSASAGAYARFGIDCRGRKRYLRAQITVGTTTTTIFRAGLSRNDTAPITAAGVGVSALVLG